VRLFLFDVDGTLVRARGVGRASMARAMETVYGTRGAIERYDFRGRTDTAALFEVLRDAGLDDRTIARGLTECFACYAGALEAAIGDGSRIEIMPGVQDVVRALSRHEDAVVGLLTGNIEPGARLKLRSTGLWPLFRVGAYGSDDPDRRRLPAIACQRAHALVGRPIPFERVTIIGDTPLDIDCARSCGAVAIAVATGQHELPELAECRPDALFADFSDVAATLATLLR